MTYYSLRKYNAQNTHEAYQREVAQRQQSPLAWQTNITLADDPLFLVEFKELSALQTKVMHKDRHIKSVMAQLPAVAQEKYIYELLVSELANTNAIEGVHSTRKELDAAIKAAKQPQSTATKRFREMARMYIQLEQHNPPFPKNAEEFRAIYDQMVSNEIDKKDMLDGELFRKNPVYIVDGNGTEIAQGISSEATITSMMGQLAAMAAEEWPSLYKPFAAHYIFERIHPFYDGNGRVGRFLLALALRDEHISLPSIFAFSHEITQRKKKYYDAFTQAEHPLNHGELSFFVFELLDLFYNGQEGTLTDLQAKSEVLERYFEYSKGLDKSTDSEIVYLVSQASLFSMGVGITLEELQSSSQFGISSQTIRNQTISLEEQGIIKTANKRPLRFLLGDEIRKRIEG